MINKAYAIEITGRGGPDKLKRVALDLPPLPDKGHVRIKVEATGVAFADIVMREGLYPEQPPFPFAPGYDVVGIIEEVASDVDLVPGSRVGALTRTGGYASHIDLSADRCAPVPDGIDPSPAVAVILNGLTAFQMMRRMARVEPGETVLIHGGAGGVGTLLLDLARHFDLKAFATASAGKHDVVTARGGIPIDYKAQDFVDVLANEGVDAVFDPVGGENLSRSRQVLRGGGRLVTYGFSDAFSGGRRNLIKGLIGMIRQPRVTGMALMDVNQGVLGYDVWRLSHQRLDWYLDDLTTVFDLLAAGALTPEIGATLPLTDAAKSHQMLGNAEVSGKIVLKP